LGNTQSPEAIMEPNEAAVEIPTRDIEPEAGQCWTAVIPALASGDTQSNPTISELQLFEDGKPLGPAHTVHDDIRARGAGAFSHWGDTLFFSASDNSDPRASGCRYSVRGPRLVGYTPHKNVLRGYGVVPSFIGQSLLDAALLDEMEHHHEAAGKSSWGTRNILHAFTLSLRPSTVLEIGAHIGSASVVIRAALKASNYGMLYCLEPQDHYYRLLTNFIEKADISEFVTPLQLFSTSPELLRTLPAKVEMIYLDANHSYSSALFDLQLCDRLLANNGLILLDDVGPEVSPSLDPEGRGGVRQAVLDFTKDRGDLQVIFMEPPFWLNPCGLGIICKQTVRNR
jgi:predicted O-methyltransferase YrrM